jgi:ABC-type multidrug transport system ATPase subunit
MMALFKFKDVSMHGDGFGAINNLSFVVEQGETLGILSADSFMHERVLSLLQGLYKPDDGQVLFFEKNCRSQRKELWSTVSFQVFEDAFSPDEKIADFIKLYQKMHQRHNKELFSSLVQKLDLNLIGLFRTLGEKNRKKLALLLALCEESKAYVLLSPFTCLNNAERSHVIHLLLSFKKNGKTVLILQDSFDYFSLICDRVILCMDGEAITELKDTEMQLAREKIYHIVFEKADEADAFAKVWDKKLTINYDRVTLKLSGSPNVLLNILKDYKVLDFIGGYHDAWIYEEVRAEESIEE